MKKSKFNYTLQEKHILQLLLAIQKNSPLSKNKLSALQKKFLSSDEDLFSKVQLVEAYKKLAGTNGLKPFSNTMLKQLQLKPVRTMSGVAPVTVLTKPFPCPGKCIFCPSDVRMPKSYLSDEPGAQRAERNFFDPYLQTYNRVKALHDMGHEVDKVELIILGGTWSFYPVEYQIWFVKECFRALNNFGHKDDQQKIRNEYQQISQKVINANYKSLSDDPHLNQKTFAENIIVGASLKEKYNQLVSQLYVAPEKKLGLDKLQTADWSQLEKQQVENETARIRCVGLVVETRPDNISPQEVKRIRRLGATKTQIGVQSLNNKVLEKNHRGHSVSQTKNAFRLLRQAGFKIHAHWMANLYGSDVEGDKKDFSKLFSDSNFCPDEIKVYPCSLIGSAELMQYYKKGLWEPYSKEELEEVLCHCLTTVPQYCRVTRVIRDIPSPNIVAGNKKTNFRQIAEQKLLKSNKRSIDIRAREIRGSEFDAQSVRLDIIRYKTSVGQEQFLQFVVQVDGQKKILAFLRLFLPKSGKHPFISELDYCAIIREIHVYGQAVKIGSKQLGLAQHGGLGTQLIEKAKEISTKEKYKKLAVISAIGTKQYYRKKGFNDGKLYQFCKLS